jgi:hypothetical protein
MMRSPRKRTKLVPCFNAVARFAETVPFKTDRLVCTKNNRRLVQLTYRLGLGHGPPKGDVGRVASLYLVFVNPRGLDAKNNAQTTQNLGAKRRSGPQYETIDLHARLL